MLGRRLLDAPLRLGFVLGVVFGVLNLSAIGCVRSSRVEAAV